ncbi:glycosyltransferase family 57 protein [Lanmaoa asiatica]|nr:glycosyltransferase family 57 protein [Lanmaoa asiatica]
MPGHRVCLATAWAARNQNKGLSIFGSFSRQYRLENGRSPRGWRILGNSQTKDRLTEFNAACVDSELVAAPSQFHCQYEGHHVRILDKFLGATNHGISDTEPAEIVSPVPRRHLLHTSESLSWLKAATFSDVDSQPRCISPLSAASSTPSVFHSSSSRRLSFSVLLEQERQARATALRRTQNEDAVYQGAVRRWVRWMHKHGMKPWVIPCAITASTYVKWCIGLGSYSGMFLIHGMPLRQCSVIMRHSDTWMELTIHLPVQQWYRYDLQYWGLDYPPLTAYASWICGKIGSWIEPSWFALDTSRGIETTGNKLFMRASVIAFDALIYVPALYAFTRTWHATRSSRTQHAALITLLFHPALLLIDFGHFQYNSVMLGFTLLAINAFAVGLDLVGAVFFVLSLGFKQMSLYYAPAIGAYLLGKYKVANFWCFTNMTVLKWKRLFDGKESFLIKGSVALTALGFLPTVAGLLWGGYKTQLPSSLPDGQRSQVQTPTLPLLPYALLTTSMSFFLFSFQVHEKTILLPLLPLTLLLSGATPGEEVFAWGALGNIVGVFSIWPLLKKDGLGVQYVATLLLWCRLIGYNPFRVQFDSFVHSLSTIVNISMTLLHLLEMVVTPPARYPDLFPVLNVLVSTPVFGLIWLWSIKRGIQVSWAIAGLPGSGTDSKIKLAKDGAQDSENEHVSAIVRRSVGGVRRDTGTRAVSLGYTGGQGGVVGGRGYGDPRRRALARLSRRAGSVDVDG